MKKLQYLKVILRCGFKIIYYHFHYMVKFAKHPERYPFEYRYQIARKEISFVLKRFNVNYNTKNFNKFLNMKSKTLIISNHLSLCDPLVLIANSEKPITFIAKKEVFKMPFVGKVAKALEVFSLDREHIMNQLSQIKEIVSYLKDPTKPSVIVYIEGTRNKKPGTPCLEFHPGTLKIAQMAGVPLISYATFGTFRVLDGKSYVKPYPTSLSFLTVYETDVVKKINTSEFAIALKKEVDDELTNLIKYDKEFILNAKISQKRKRLETRCDVSINS